MTTARPSFNSTTRLSDVINKEGFSLYRAPIVDGKVDFYVTQFNDDILPIKNQPKSTKPMVDGVFLRPESVSQLSGNDLLLLRDKADLQGFAAEQEVLIPSFPDGSRPDFRHIGHMPKKDIKELDDDAFLLSARKNGLFIKTADSPPPIPEIMEAAQKNDVIGPLITGGVITTAGIIGGILTAGIPVAMVVGLSALFGTLSGAAAYLGLKSNPAIRREYSKQLLITGKDPKSELHSSLSGERFKQAAEGAESAPFLPTQFSPVPGFKMRGQGPW